MPREEKFWDDSHLRKVFWQCIPVRGEFIMRPTLFDCLIMLRSRRYIDNTIPSWKHRSKLIASIVSHRCQRLSSFKMIVRSSQRWTKCCLASRATTNGRTSLNVASIGNCDRSMSTVPLHLSRSNNGRALGNWQTRPFTGCCLCWRWRLAYLSFLE